MSCFAHIDTSFTVTSVATPVGFTLYDAICDAMSVADPLTAVSALSVTRQSVFEASVPVSVSDSVSDVAVPDDVRHLSRSIPHIPENSRLLVLLPIATIGKNNPLPEVGSKV